MEIGLWIAQYSLLGIYGAYGIYKTFFSAEAKEKCHGQMVVRINSSVFLVYLNF